ncbi:aldehyde dehydrogenase family protein [Pseudoduganella aquatica]|uniref:aldehyde dehydrogenase family protein n=1 Tax=Pseudoduganella aquatica TaxID=2660641 RepID=UPI001E61B4BA|nr:aldehyde dehydrogenase family protein [Pseudoduganella aquatica]
MNNPNTSAVPLPQFAWTSLDTAARRAEEAAEALRHSSVEERCRLLELISLHVGSAREAVAASAAAELGASPSAIAIEHDALLQQLRACSAVLRRHHWLGAAIETAPPGQRVQNIALGPVAVLGTGTDCAAPVYAAAAADALSALAAGCPVLVRGSASHPRTCALLAEAIATAVRASGLPQGVYSLVAPSAASAGALLCHPDIKAATFSGNRAEGMALMRRSLDRSEPVPVLLETAGSNPVFILPHALNARAEHLGQQLLKHFSPCTGHRQFKPGMVVAIEGDGYIDLRETIIDGIQALPPVALAGGARQDHAGTVERLLRSGHVDLLAEGKGDDEGEARNLPLARAVFAEAEACSLLAAPVLAEDRPGPAGLLLRCACPDELMAVAARLGPQLVASLHMDSGDTALAARLMPQLERMARHVNVNSFTSMPVFSGATAAQAMARFLRPVFYLDVPSSLLPAALQDANPLHLWRQVDGEMRH